jgi:hypothetical protein
VNPRERHPIQNMTNHAAHTGATDDRTRPDQ